MTSAEELHARLQELWRKHLPVMKSRLATVDRALEALNRGELTHKLRFEAAENAHKLAGSLGTFSLQSGSDAAGEIERLFSSDTDLRESEIDRVAECLAELERVIESK